MKSRFYTRFKLSIAATCIVAVLSGCSSSSKWDDGTSPRDSFKIVINQSDGECRWDILDGWEDQEAFEILSNGTVEFVAKGADAFFIILDDPRGISPVDDPRVRGFTIKEGASKKVRVRTRYKNSDDSEFVSFHQIFFDCCPDGMCAPSVNRKKMNLDRFFENGLPKSGPSASQDYFEEWLKLIYTGPVMKVRDR